MTERVRRRRRQAAPDRRTFLPFPALLLLLSGVLAPAARAQSTKPIESFWVSSGTVTSVTESNGVLYVGGNYFSMGPFTDHAAELDDGTGQPNLAFPKVNGRVVAAAPDGAGGWFLGGTFTQVGGLARANLAHVLADGRVSQWNPGAAGSVFVLRVVGSVVYAGGTFTFIGGQTRNRIAALDAATGVVSAWDPSASGIVRDILPTAGTIYVAGDFTTIGGQTRNHAAALDPVSGLAGSWNPNVDNYVFSMALSGGRVYLGGYFTNVGGSPRNHLAAVDAVSGALAAWNPNASNDVFTVCAVGNTLYAGGSFLTVGGQSRAYLAAIDMTTGLATSWNPSPSSWVYRLVATPSRLYAGGFFTSMGLSRGRLAAFDVGTGALLAWDPNAMYDVYAVAAWGNKVLAGGDFWSVGAETRWDLRALDAATGVPVPTQPPMPEYSVFTYAEAANVGFVGGAFGVMGATTRNYLGAFDTSTGALLPWNPNADQQVRGLVVDGANVYAGGFFTSVGGQTRNRLAALSTTTGLATAWNPGADGSVLSLQRSGPTLYAGGSFTNVAGQGRNRLASFDLGTGSLTAWNPDASGSVNALRPAGSLVYLGGAFTSVGGQARSRLAAVDAGTGTIAPWNPGANGTVGAIDVAGSSVFVGGTFTTIAGQSRNNLAAVKDDGTLGGWNPGPTSQVWSVAVSGNLLYVGGDFASIAGQSRRGLAAFCLIPPPTTLNATPAGPNRIDLVWTSTGAPSYEVLRARQSGGPYALLTTVPGTSYSDTTVDGGVAYYYVVRAKDFCSSDETPEASAVATGSCSLPPDFEGAAWSDTLAGPTCSLAVGWAPAGAPCGGSVSYSVYRDTSASFTPSLANRIASGLSATSYADATAQPATGYYYIVRADSSATGLQDANLIRQSALTGACSLGPPSPVTALTVRSTTGQNELRWVNPATGSYGLTRIRYRLDTFPIDENDGTLLVNKVGTPGAPDSYSDTGLSNDVTVYYAAFVDNGAGAFSSGRNTSGRPFNTAASNAKWALSIGMSAMVPPGNGIGQIHAVGQDNNVYSMVKGATGGSWPPLWLPQSLSGPSQGRPSTLGLPFAVGGATRVIFLGSQGGTVYALNADSGQVVWSRSVSGPVQAAPSGWFSFYGGSPGIDYILVGTRDGTLGVQNRFYALRLADGSVAWSYDGAADSRKIGMISGQATVDYVNKRLYFASAAFGAGVGERDTVWCLDLETGTRIWSAEVSDVTGSAVARGDRLYVASYTPGTSGNIHALDASTGASVWGGASFVTPDSEGPVKSFVAPDRLSAGGRLLFSTNDVLWALDDPSGSSAPPAAPTWVRDATVESVTRIANPSQPAFLAGGPYIWVGSSDGKLYRLDYATGATQLATPLGDTAIPSAVGAPTVDLGGGFLYVGSVAGVIYAVAFP